MPHYPCLVQGPKGSLCHRKLWQRRHMSRVSQIAWQLHVALSLAICKVVGSSNLGAFLIVFMSGHLSPHGKSCFEIRLTVSR